MFIIINRIIIFLYFYAYIILSKINVINRIIFFFMLFFYAFINKITFKITFKIIFKIIFNIINKIIFFFMLFFYAFINKIIFITFIFIINLIAIINTTFNSISTNYGEAIIKFITNSLGFTIFSFAFILNLNIFIDFIIFFFRPINSFLSLFFLKKFPIVFLVFKKNLIFLSYYCR